LIAYLAVIALGTYFLALSYQVQGIKFSILDTFADSTSAFTVSGLWFAPSFYTNNMSLFGQIVLIGIAQIGGLSSFILPVLVFQTALGGKMTIAEKKSLKSIFGTQYLSDVVPLIKRVLIYSFFIELAGTLAYLVSFSAMYPLGEAIYYSIWHSVSAFCNCGFTLFASSYMGWSTDWYFNLVSMALIILGGLGFVVLTPLKGKIVDFILRRQSKRFDLHTKIVLSMSLILTIAGTLVFFAFDASKMNLPFGDQFLISLFQSVTARTAGFNTADFSQASNATLYFFIILMYIGAGPLSTSGGIKVTTFALAVLALWRVVRGKSRVELWNHSVPEGTLWTAVYLIIFSMIVVGSLYMILLVTEANTVDPNGVAATPLRLLFELVSAFGNVGLSTGPTVSLGAFFTVPGKLVMTFAMLFGKVGPMALLSMFARRGAEETSLIEDQSITVG
jgi:trk system potassium uptake protein TrkH